MISDQALTTGTLPVPLPRVPGHEIVGDVIDKLLTVGIADPGMLNH